MQTILARAKEAPQRKTLNISDLPRFDVNMELKTFSGKDQKGESFQYDYVEDKDGNKYRIPVSVLTQLHVFLEENPNHKQFKVKRNGQGMQTTYTLIPVMSDE